MRSQYWELTFKFTIYGLNDDAPHFYEPSVVVNDLEKKVNIIVGDYNLMMNPGRDYYNYLHLNNPKARDKGLEMMTQLKLRKIRKR